MTRQSRARGRNGVRANASKRVVIDASVASAAGGEEATFPTSKPCRDFLRAFLDTSHSVVMTSEIRDEWNRHQSGFARAWRSSMVSRRRMTTLDPTIDENLLRRIENSSPHENPRAAMRKDFRLIAAAFAADKIIASLDEEARSLFDSATTSVAALKAIAWINPDIMEEGCAAWLQSGAKHERKRLLGYRRRAS